MFFNHVLGFGVAPQPHPSPTPPAGGEGSVLTRWPWIVWQWLTGHWPLLLWCLVFAVAAVAAWYAGRRWLQRRAVGRGTWLEVVPPRQTAVTASAAVWRLLLPLARKADTGWHLVHPPLTVEIHGDGRGRLALAVWVPKWVSASVVATEVRRAWPGALVRPFVAPMADEAFTAAGFRLAATDDEMLVDDVYLRSRLGASVSADGDPLRAVFDALREAGGPTVLQLLAKPASSKRVSKLASAARQPVKPRKPLAAKAVDLVIAVVAGGLRFVLDVATTSTPSHGQYHHAGSRPEGPDPLQRLAMRRAADKLKGGPHLLVAIRAVALRPSRGWAVADASSLANGYRVAAWGLRPKRLWWARSAVSDRFAHKGEWLLATCSELGVLFHLPADPARFGFTVAAASRPFPHQATRIRPEHRDGTEPGWSRGEWVGPPDTTQTALAIRENDGHDEGRELDPWGLPLPEDTHPHSENNQFIDDDIDTDWDQH